MQVSGQFQKWGLGFSGCDGGDMGTSHTPSIWICGIEWGGGHSPEGLSSHIKVDVSHPPEGYEDYHENLAYIFNWQVMKLLCVVNGGFVSNYSEFARDIQPFVKGMTGYFKMNLYPIGFKDTSHNRWHSNFSQLTGFEGKSDYLAWCSSFRFPQIRQWAKSAKPKLILCLGKTYLDNFKSAFHEENVDFNHEIIDDRDLYWSINQEGSLVAVVPFMVNRHGLVRNISIQKFGERISQLLESQKIE